MLDAVDSLLSGDVALFRPVTYGWDEFTESVAEDYGKNILQAGTYFTRIIDAVIILVVFPIFELYKQCKAIYKAFDVGFGYGCGALVLTPLVLPTRIVVRVFQTAIPLILATSVGLIPYKTILDMVNIKRMSQRIRTLNLEFPNAFSDTSYSTLRLETFDSRSYLEKKERERDISNKILILFMV